MRDWRATCHCDPPTSFRSLSEHCNLIIANVVADAKIVVGVIIVVVVSVVVVYHLHVVILLLCHIVLLSYHLVVPLRSAHAASAPAHTKAIPTIVITAIVVAPLAAAAALAAAMSQPPTNC